MAFMTSLLYLSCFSYTLTLVIMYHILCKIYLVALQLSFYVMFFLSETKFLYLCIYLSMHHIFTLKFSTPIYANQFLNTFCHFINSIVAKFYDQMPFLMPAGMIMGPKIFIQEPSLGDFQPRLQSDSPAHEMQTASCQAPNWYFKVSGIIKTQILFKPLVIKTQILSLDRLNSLNASVVLIQKPVN